jgi:predicted nucleotidyltransferase/biotin operon repressor
MIESFDKYMDLKVLGYFLLNPKKSIHIKELARTLEISPMSVSHAVKLYEEKGYLIKEEKGLAHYYHLNVGNPVIRPLKTAYGLDLILSAKPEEVFLNVDPNIISLALYGSYANGAFDEASDVDFLVVTASKKEKLLDAIMELEDKLGREVNVSAFKLSDWLALAKKSDAFYKNVTANHVLLYGADI